MDLEQRKMTRREALAALSALALSAGIGLSARAAEATGKSGIALQLYTMRTPAGKDLADTLKKCREMGWEAVQWSGMPNLPAEKIREALDTAGMKMIACHTSMEAFEKDFDAQVKFWKTCGCKDVAPGGMMNDCKKDLAAWKKGCERLNAIGGKLKDVGMRLSYHNHAFELEKFPDDPRRKLDILLESAPNVNMEIDVAWAFEAGVNPAEYLKKYAGRCPVIHIKDLIPQGKGKVKFMPLGQGKVNLLDVIKAGKESGVEWFTYEQDGGEGSPFGYAKTSYEFLKKNGF